MCRASVVATVERFFRVLQNGRYEHCFNSQGIRKLML